MSDTATSWAKANPCKSVNPRTGEIEGDRNAKHVLTDMAAYADVDGFVWAAVPVLAIECEVSERMIQRGIAALLKNGLLEETDRRQLWRGKWLPVYRMPIEKGFPNTRARLQAERVAASRVTPVSPVTEGGGEVSGDVDVTPTGDAGVGVGVTPVSPDYLKDPIELPTDSPNPGARAGEEGFDRQVEGVPDPFEAVLADWLAAEVRAKAGRTSPDAARAAWRMAAAGHDPLRLATAVRAALADDADFKRRGPPALERWLGKGLFAAWLKAEGSASGGAQGSAAAPTVPGWPPPPDDLRTAFASAFGPAKAASWWPGGWREADRTLIAGTGVGRDWLKSNARTWMQANTVTVISRLDAERDQQE